MGACLLRVLVDWKFLGEAEHKTVDCLYTTLRYKDSDVSLEVGSE